MSLTLITQLAGDKPQILLVGGHSFLTLEVSRHFERHDLVVNQRQPGSFLSAAPFKEEYYQVVFLMGWESERAQLLENLAHFTKLFENEEVRPERLTLVVPSWSFWSESDQELVEKMRAVFELALRHNPLARVVIGLDVVTQDLGANLPLKMMLSKVAQGEVIDPRLQLSLISQQRFGLILKTLLKQAGSGEMALIGGKTQSTKQVAAEVVRSASVFKHRAMVVPGVSAANEVGYSLEVVIKKLGLRAEVVDDELESESLPTLLKPLITEDLLLGKGLKKHGQDESGAVLPKPTQRSSGAFPPPIKPTFTQGSAPVATPAREGASRPISTPAQRSSLQSALPKYQSQFQPQSQPPRPISSSTQNPNSIPQSARQPAPLSQPPDHKKAVDEKLSTLFSLQRLSSKTDHLVDLHQKTKKVKQKNKKRRFSFVFGTVVVAMGVVALGLMAGFWFSTTLLKQELVAITTAGPDQLFSAREVDQSLVWKTNLVEQQIAFYSTLLPESFFMDSSLLVTISNEMSALIEDLNRFNVGRQSLVLQVVGAPYSPAPPLELSEIERLYERVSLLSASIDEYAQDQALAGGDDDLTQLIEEINAKRASLAIYQQLAGILPDVLGQSGKRSYALVFQNEQELRPTGGFIQAIAILTFDNSMLIDSQVFSSYHLDNRLAAIIDPPEDLKQVLGEERFFVRDSNWNPDFEMTAKQIGWFVEEIMGRKVAGVIGINNAVLQDVLRAIGPLELVAYDEVLTDRNLLERMEYHSEVDLVESAETRDYSVLVLGAILQKITNLDQDKALDLLAGLHSGLKQKNLFISLFNQDEASVLANLGWSGALLSPGCPGQLVSAPCLVESLAVVDSNVGINKANYYLKRQQRHSAQLETQAILHSHTLTLTNEATTNAWPKGAYSSYLRFFIPVESSFEEVVVNDRKIDLSDLIITKTGSHQIIGVKTITPISEQSTISFRYRTPLLPEQLESESLSYGLFVQKQPGVDQALGAISLNYPSSLTPTLIAPQASVDLDGITFTDFENEHLFVGATFTKR